MLRITGIMLSALVVFAAVVNGSDQLQVGMTAPTSVVATFVPGGWVEKQQKFCAVLAHRDASKVAIFAKDSNEQVMPLVKAIDDLVAADSSIKWSFLFVSHENNPTPSQEEWDEQLHQLQQLATDHHIAHLATGIMIRIPDAKTPTKAKRQVGIFNDGDVVLMLIRPGANNRGVIRHFMVLESKKMESGEIERITNDLKDAIARTTDAK